MPSYFFLHLLMAFASQNALALPDEISGLCSRWSHQSVVKGNKLYIDGGVETYCNGGNCTDIVTATNKYLIEVDLSTSWDSVANATQNIINKTEISEDLLTVPSLMNGALYQGGLSDSKVWLYGGEVYGNDSQTYADIPLWSYDIGEGLWDLWYATGFDNPNYPNSGAYAEAPAHNLAFYLNGEQGMMVIDTMYRSPRWVSTYSLGPSLLKRGLSYLEGVGEMGALVALGGYSNGSSIKMANFSDVAIADISPLRYYIGTVNSTWYHQSTTGDIPEPRIDFCIVTKSAPDNSSHNIYMYGGYDPSQSKVYSDMYVLSLPSFTWTKVSNGPYSHWKHTCHALNGRQMIVVGGSIDADDAECEWKTYGYGIIDMTTLAWNGNYDVDGPSYEVPFQVFNVIGGSGTGGATMTSPKHGFAHAAIATLFGQSTHKSASNRIGIIIGCVIGGCAVLAFAAAAILYRRHLRQTRALNQTKLDRDDVGLSESPPRYSATERRPSETAERGNSVELDALHREEERPQLRVAIP